MITGRVRTKVDSGQCLVMLFVVFTICILRNADAQADPFALVGFDDTTANISATTQKTYTTTMDLDPLANVDIANFNPNTFVVAVQPYYSNDAGLVGFNSIVVTKQETVNGNLRLTYNVVYVYANLISTPGISDDFIASTIGNYDAIRTSVNSGSTDLLSFYRFPENNAGFSFSGDSLCDQASNSCPANTQCTETLGGIAVECKSPCKAEYCQNNGTCAQANTDVTPTCTCLSKADLWFLGAQCQTMVALWMVIVGVIGCFLVILAAIILACCCYAARRRRKEKESQLFGISDVNAYTNKGYVANEGKKEEIETITRNGYQERYVGGATSAARRSRSRSRSPSRRRRSRTSSYRRRGSRSHSRERHQRRSNRSSRTESDRDSFDEDSSEVSQDEVEVMKMAPRQHSGSSSSGSSASTPVKTKTATTASNSFDTDSISLRNQGTSPIRWVQTSKSPTPMPGNKMGKVDIADRKGWMPSLGPQMFDLARSREDLSESSTLPSNTHFADTDV
ncbi:unnamed protein product [Clavelina lepadiformis]|uniref:EGF-like domain-containing protein n=1 Tax=Clavelina lepadiformis TaxID=159417 RepID=A0ABP0GH52_CLALP